MKIAVCTDSNSGITQRQAAEMGIYVLPMPFMIDNETFLEDITLTQEEFFVKLKQGADLSTSQPAPYDVTKLWNEALKENDAIIYIPMSSGLSASCATAIMLANEYAGRVYVIDNKRISVTLRQAVLDAIALVKAGYDCEEISRILMENSSETSIYVMVDTFKYLKKGGRVSPTAAAVGSILNIKPVLQLSDEKLEAYAKAKGVRQAKKIMIKAMRNDFDTRFASLAMPDEMALMVVYTDNPEQALEFKSEVQEAFPGFDIFMDRLSLSVACHIGPGALAVACARKIKC